MRTNSILACSLITIAALAAGTARGQFTTGSVVVLREGDGVNALAATGSPIFVDEYAAATANQVAPTFSQNLTAALASSGVNFLMSGAAASEGQLSLSADGHLLVVPGYNYLEGTSGNIASTTAAQAPRGYVTLDAGGNISPFSSSPDQFSGTNIRSVAMNGPNVYGVGAAGGVLLFPADSYVDTTQANNRVIRILNGNVCFSTASGTTGVWTFNGAPTGAASASVLIADGSSGTSPYGFDISPDGTKAYIADDGNSTSGNATGFGVERWNQTNGAWTFAYSIATNTTNGDGGARGLAVDWTGTNPVIYATTSPTGVTPNELVRIVDNAGSSSTVTVLAAAPANEHFSGVALAPTPAATTAPAFGLQPTAATIVVGQTGNFSVSALGYPAATFQWQVSTNGGSSWSNLTDGGIYAGSLTPALSVTPSDTSLTGDHYRCLAINSAGTATSSSALLTVTGQVAPSFTAQPLSQVVSSGQSATFAVAASGNPAPTFQWQQALAGNSTFTNLANGGSFTGVTTASMTIAGTTVAMSGNQYRCVVSNLAGATNSNAASLTVNPSTTPPFVPGDLVVLRTGVGGSASLTNQGSDIYVDEFDPTTANQVAPLFSTNVTGSLAASGNFVMSGVATAEGHMSLSADGHFLCIPVFKNISVVGASVATSTSTACPRGYVLMDANGNYSAAVTSPTAFTGTDIRASFSAGTSIYGSGAGGGIFLFQSGAFVETQINNTRVVRIENGNICFSTALTGNVGIWQFQGIPTANATVTEVIPINIVNASPYGFAFSPNGTVAYVADDGGNGNTSLAANAGIQHWVLSNGNWTNDYIIHLSPGNLTVGARGLLVDWSGANPIIYATSSNANTGSVGNQLVMIVDNAQANSTITVLATAAANTAFRAVDFAPVVNASSSAPTITSQPGNQTITAGQSAVFELGASGAPAPTIQWQMSPDGGVTWNNLADNVTYAGSLTPILTVNTTFAMASTMLELRSVATNFGGSTTSNVTILTITPPPPAAPTITTQPLSQSVDSGEDAVLTVVTTGFPLPTYQWYEGNVALSDGNLSDGANITGSQSATLTINNIQQGEQGNYSVVVTNSQGNITSNVTTLTVDVFPDVEDTSDAAVFAGQNAVFTANVTGVPTPTLQWQREPAAGGSFTNLSEGGNYTGTTTATLTVSNTTLAMSGDQFQLVATNAAGSDIGPSATLTVSSGTIPSITTQPSNETISAGGNTSFTSGATGTPAPTFQWQSSSDGGVTWGNLTDGNGITGSGTNMLAVSNATLAMNGSQYRMLAVNAGGTTPSSAASLTVTAAPAITTQPVNVTVTAGVAATFIVAASGNPTPTFEWQVSTNSGTSFGNLSDGGGISGSGTGNLTLSGTTGTMSGNEYRALAINTLGTVASTTATLTVNTPPAFSTQPGNATVLAGGNATFTAGASGQPSATFQWQISTNGGVTWTNLSNGSGVSGATTGTLVISGSMLGMTGTEYRVVATNSVSSTTSNAVTLTVTSAPAITLQPVDDTVTEGNQASFTAAASGQPSPELQWQLSTDSGADWSNLTDGGNVSGSTTGTLTINNTDGTMSGNQFRMVATNSVSSATSEAATLTVNTAPAITMQPANITATVGNAAIFTAAASGQPTPALQWQVSTDSGADWNDLTDGGNVAGSATGTLTVSNTTEAMSGYSYRLVASNVISTATSDAGVLTVDTLPAFTANSPTPANATVIAGNQTTFTVSASGIPTPTLQWQLSTDSGADWSNLSDNATISGSTTDSLTVNTTTAGTFQFRAVATNEAGNVTSNVTVLTVHPNVTPPTISEPPLNVVALSGTSAKFTVVAMGTAPLTYQWSLNGKAIANATQANYTITKVSTTNVGNYSVVVRNGQGTANATATLSIGVAPKISTSPASVTVTAPATANFKTAAAGTPAPQVVWQFSTNGGTGWSNLTTGANVTVTNTTLAVANTSGSETGSQIRVYAWNAVGNATSKVATLTVNVPPGVPTFTSNLTSGNGTLAAGGSVKFSATDASGTSLVFQWSLNGKKISGATASSLTIANAGTLNSGNYTVTASNKQGSETSGNFTLIVLVKPTIKTQPKALTVNAGKNATFSVVANNSFGLGNLTYQWMFGGANITTGGQFQGATNATLTISGVTAANGGAMLYQVQVSNNAGSIVSSGVKLTVK